jgi:uncharacterized protein YkwD
MSNYRRGYYGYNGYYGRTAAHRAQQEQTYGVENLRQTFIQQALAAHNARRARHNAPPLTLNRELCEIAQRYADYLASIGDIPHSGASYRGKVMGENLHMGNQHFYSGKILIAFYGF